MTPNDWPRPLDATERDELDRYRSRLERGFQLDAHDLRHFQHLRNMDEAWEQHQQQQGREAA